MHAAQTVPHRTCFTLSGESYWAVANSVWARLWEEAFVPDRLVVVTHAPHKRVAHDAATALRAVLGEPAVRVEPEVIVFAEADFADAHEKLRSPFQGAKGQREVALNVTPARKSLAVVAMGRRVGGEGGA